MRCDDAQILLSTRRDLNMSQRAELDAHMGTCRACAAARREEERVSRLLAQLPDPGLAAPPRVAAAVAARVARRSAHERRTHGLALAASLGAVALVAAVLLNIVTGGALGRLIAGGPREQPAAQGGAAAPSASAAARGDLLYLIHRPGQGAARLSAWEPAADRTLFSVPLGEPPPYIPSDQPATFVSVPPRDVALAPDGRRLYVIEYGERIDLVAYDARGGAELWRSALTNYAPFITLEGGGSLTVSPDGARVFVRQVSSQPRLGSALIGVALRAFAADDGRELGPTTELLPETVLVFPLSQHSALTVTSGGMTARIPLDGNRRLPVRIEGVAAAALLPGGRTLHAVTPDLRVLEVVLMGEAMRVAQDTDLVARGGFFFDVAAFSPDGQVLAVGQGTWDAQTGAVGSEVRIYRAGPWREVARHTLTRPLTGLTVSADGGRAYAALGRADSYRVPPGRQRPTPAPRPAADARSPQRGVLASFDTTTGQVSYPQELDLGIVGLLAGR